MPWTTLWDFDGRTYVKARDGERLGRSLRIIRDELRDGAWHTIRELADLAGCSDAAASARIRDLRKPKFGGHVIDREYRGDGLWVYRMTEEKG